MNFEIRQLEDTDFSDKSGFVETMANMSDVSNLDLDQLKTIWQKAKQQDAYFFVAVSQEEDSKDQIVATVKLLVEPKFFHGAKAAGHIEDVVVDKEFQGQKIGEKIIKYVLGIAKNNDCYKTILDCSDDVKQFYEKLGFKHHSNELRFNHI